MEWNDIKKLTEYEAKQIVKAYFLRGSFEANEIDTRNQPEGLNIPDLEVTESNEVSAYCEIKTPEHIIHPVTNMYHWNTTINKLRAFSRKAIKQLEAFDPTHKVPHIIVFTSNHPQLNWTNCIHHIQGAVAYDGKVIRDFRNKETGWDLSKDLEKIELIIWLQINYLTRKDIVQASHILNKDSKLLTETEVISRKLPLGNTP